MRSLLFLFAFLHPFILYAQLTEDFQDGELLFNPTWKGDLSAFVVNNDLMLQLHASEPGKASIFTAQQQLDSTEWIVDVKLAFNPSSNNNCRIYLASTNTKQGVFLQLGESGSKDSPELFYYDDQEQVSICRAEDGLIANAFFLRFKIVHHLNNNWEIYYANPNDDFILCANGHYTPNFSSENMIIECKYTSSNVRKFYFDNITVRDIQVDQSPPYLEDLKVIDSKTLNLTFNESIQDVDVQNFTLTPSMIHPQSVIAEAPTELSLEFEQEFQENVDYQLLFENLADLYGNILPYGEYSFNYQAPYFPKPFDLLINELMVDINPSPPNLPAFDYLEIYNRTTKNIDLSKCILDFGKSSKTFPPGTSIDPKGFLLICDEASGYEQDYNCCTYSNFSLNNSGQIILYDSLGTVLHFVSYDQDFYDDAIKAEGGWSLELMDENNPCGGDANWTASIADDGGSPGKINSVHENNPDEQEIEAIRAHCTSDTSILLEFSESLYPANFSPNWIRVGENLQIKKILFQAESPEYLEIITANSLKEGVIYELSVMDSICDCAGNVVLEAKIAFGLPDARPVEGLVINEVLFDAWDSQGDFIELYNNTEKIKDLRNTGLFFVLRNKEILVCDTYFQMLPDSYLVLCKDIESVKANYSMENAHAYLEIPNFPNLRKDSLVILLQSHSGEIADAAVLGSYLHHVGLYESKGVSLEKVHPNLDGRKPQAWHSAAGSYSYATPAARNSQYQEIQADKQQIFRIEPKVFSPNMDGFDDLLKIIFKPDREGCLLTIRIFHDNGTPVRNLIYNELCANSENKYFWNGCNDNGNQSPSGIYIIYANYIHPNGSSESFKAACYLKN